jgi:hypothetical protein
MGAVMVMRHGLWSFLRFLLSLSSIAGDASGFGFLGGWIASVILCGFGGMRYACHM